MIRSPKRRLVYQTWYGRRFARSSLSHLTCAEARLGNRMPQIICGLPSLPGAHGAAHASQTEAHPAVGAGDFVHVQTTLESPVDGFCDRSRWIERLAKTPDWGYL